jgi:hypothetical protein
MKSQQSEQPAVLALVMASLNNIGAYMLPETERTARSDGRIDESTSGVVSNCN